MGSGSALNVAGQLRAAAADPCVQRLTDLDADARVLRLVSRHGGMLARVAQKWSLCADDALDAYQRALEIYLRRLDSVEEATEVSWLAVVVKNEALAIRRQRAETVPAEELDFDSRPAERLRPVEDVGAARARVGRAPAAHRALKPDEARALGPQAQGLSYVEIAEALGWTYTKVNRCITEGRARFLDTYARIEAGEIAAASRPHARPGRRAAG